MTKDTTKTYEPPRLRALGSVHDLTQGNIHGNVSDGILLHRTVNGS
ncbi:MAG TPA: lasso RiPP family leader peptide-containing protein [Solirubrobacteraceae bacterium]|nr:lasso RiPP family leader peptide-containing protein [Solirubrobacteraceae bacterium]